MKLADFMQGDGVQGQGAEVQKLNGARPEQDDQAPIDQVQQEDGDMQEDGGMRGEEPAPEEQEIYERVVLAGVKVINESAEQFLKMLQAGGENPAQSMADATWLLMSQIDEQSDGEIDEEILLAAGAEVLENIGELANEAGLFAVDKGLLNQSYQLIVARFAEEFGADFSDLEGEIAATDEKTLMAQMGL